MRTDLVTGKALLPTTPWEALGDPVRETVIIEGRSFLLERPENSHNLMKNPVVRSALAADDCIPYWADLWPAARMLGKVLVQDAPWWPAEQPPETLEIGCGLGLPGIVALSLGMRVTFSDYDATALRYASSNARLNGFEQFQTLQMDWNHPPRDRRWPVLLAADLIYEMRNVEPLVTLIPQLLAPGGVCLLTDQDRVPSHVLRATLTSHGLPFTTRMVRAGEPGGRRLKGTLYRIQLPDNAKVS